MSFDDYLKQAWTDHNTSTLAVADGLSSAPSLITQTSELAQFAALVTHVMGQHLGRFDDAIQLLNQLREHPRFDGSSESAGALNRSLATLQLATNKILNLDPFSASDQSRTYALAASLLSERDTVQAREYLITAMSIAASELEKDDPAIQSLAATTHNLAAALEVKKNLAADEIQLMLEAALASRRYWEICGTWVEVKQAEYRLAMVTMRAGKLSEAEQHARTGIQLCEANNASALEYYFAFEALALVALAQGNIAGFTDAATKARGQYLQLTLEDKKYCEESLQGLNS